MAALSWSFSCGVRPPRVTLMTLAEYANVSVLTIVLPMFWFNCAVSDRPG